MRHIYPKDAVFWTGKSRVPGDKNSITNIKLAAIIQPVTQPDTGNV